MPRCQTCGSSDTKKRREYRRTWEVCPDDFHEDPLPEPQATAKRVLELEQDNAFLRAKLEDLETRISKLESEND